MSNLHNLQVQFAQALAKLIQAAPGLGFDVVFAEAYRTPEQAALNDQKGVGIKNSLHTLRLAVDLIAFPIGTDQMLTDSQAYEKLGVYFESLGGIWGGRFSKPDGDHFSFEYNGVK